MAVTNSAVDSSRPARMSQAAGTTVRYGRMREAEDDPGRDPGREQETAVTGLAEQPAGRPRRARARRGRRARPPGDGSCGSRFLVCRPRPPGGRPAVSLASPDGARHDGPRRSLSAAATASRSVATRTSQTRDPGSGAGPTRGTIARRNPSRAASRRRRSRPSTARSSPSSPTSPMTTCRRRSAGRAATKRAPTPSADPAPARSTVSPPARLAYTSWLPSPIPARRPSTATSSARRFGSRPLAVARAASRTPAGATSAWTSTSNGRLPSRVGATTLPGRGAVVLGEERAAGSATSTQARPGHLEDADLLGRAEAVLRGPQRAGAPRSARPRAASTASTRCSSVFGPAMEPSLVTWPTSTTAIALALGEAPSGAAPTRGPGRRCRPAPSSSSTVAVWIESTTTSAGRRGRAASTIRPTSGSARTSPRRRPGPRAGRGGRRAAGPGRPTPRPIA